MPETIIESVLAGKVDTALLFKWLNNDNVEDTPEDSVLYSCNRNEFVAYFLSFLRSQTSNILQINNSSLPPLHQTPEKFFDSRRKHRRSISDPTSDDRKDSLTVKQPESSHESPSKDRRRTGRKVKTKLFPEDRNLSISSDESKLSLGMEKIALSSTPLKNGLKLSDYPNLASPVPTTPHRSFKEHERCDTPRLSHRHRLHEKSCFGDYLVNAQKSSKKKKGSKNASDDSELKLDLSNIEVFPEIGARKSNSLRSDRKRIKPTNIDKSTSQKSLSLSSFNSDCFQQLSPLALQDNAAFKQEHIQPKEASNTFEAERSMLKMERHKLMEKFNILNTTLSPKPTTPQIKITQKDSFEKVQTVEKANTDKILFRDKLDFLVDIYEVLVNTNLILSVNSEIYFLISILLSNQFEDEYLDIELHLKEKNINYLLKSIHNCTYFAVKALWNLKTVLEVILDKNSLKILGENKKVRSFYPDLAKFLLNSYGLKCEIENNQERKDNITRCSNGVICFNHETDNVDNFPSMLSFQNFKKQRDMFYEIVRWYQESLSTGSSRTSFRARIKTLLSCGVSPSNYAHLAALFMQHMLAECLPANTQESKLSKLQRRLTCPTVTESHRLPRFSDKETFYKEFIMYTENEPFRVHLKDALCSEIVNLDSTVICTEDRGNANACDISKEYQNLVKKLGLLSKFLGFLTSLPYTHTPEQSSKIMVTQRDPPNQYMPPKEKVLDNNIALRNHNQPSININGMLWHAYKNCRLIVTVPWVVHYLSMLDYASLRIKYYVETLKILHHIYVHRLKLNGCLKKTTVIFLKSVLGWLFDLPHCPQDIVCEGEIVDSDVNLDVYEVIDEVILYDLCPYLKDVNILLSTCKVGQSQKDIGSFRHITPVSLSLNPEDRLRNKEKELQARLEEEMLKSQPSSTRRVLEMVTERVTAGTVRDLAKSLALFRDRAMTQAAKVVKERGNMGQADLLQTLQNVYTEQLSQLRTSAVECSKDSIRQRTSEALQALLPSAPQPILALAINNCLNRLNRWINDHWNTTAILCKDIKEEMKTLIALGDACCSSPKPSLNIDAIMAPTAEFEANNISPTTCIINLKEQICLLLDEEEPHELSKVIGACARCVSPNNLFSRPPTQKALLQLSVDLCIVYVSRKPNKLTANFLNTLHSIWNVCCPDRKRSNLDDSTLPERRSGLSPELRNFEDERAQTPISDNESSDIKIVTNFKIVTDTKNISVGKNISEVKSVNGDINGSAASEKSSMLADEHNSDEHLQFFDRILCPRNILLLSLSKCKQAEVWEALATVLVFLLKNDYLSEDSLTEQCLAVYRQDWPQNILENLSNCMKSVSVRWSHSSTGKFTLFLDFLAEYCGDMDYEPSIED
ncbi:hypothetical protein ACJJTC_019122 [Scirpophaga incertulas]